MGLLDQLSSLTGGDAAKVRQRVEELLDDVGGVSGLVEKFEATGLGAKAKSWVGVGANEAVSPEEVKAALGPGELEKVASESGTDADGAAQSLSAALPDIIDKLTPDGKIPGAEALKDRLNKLLS